MSNLDEEFLARFEAGAVDADSFHHADHVRAAWLLLRATSLVAALSRFEAAARGLAESAGRPERFHRTITWAYLLIVSDRMASGSSDESFGEFAERCPDLLDWPGTGLRPWYREETLASDAARERFVFPEPYCRIRIKKRRRQFRGSR